MTRSDAREVAAHLIYQLDYTGEVPQEAIDARMAREYYDGLAQENAVYSDRPSGKQLSYIRACVNGVAAQADKLDDLIRKYAIGWNLHRISRFAKAAMRLAIYEVLCVEDVPTGVAINECVELIRKYENEEVVAFVNGILGSVVRGLKDTPEWTDAENTEIADAQGCDSEAEQGTKELPCIAQDTDLAGKECHEHPCL